MLRRVLPLLVALTLPVFAADPSSLPPAKTGKPGTTPPAPPSVPQPTSMDVVVFQLKAVGDNNKITVSSAPNIIRFDDSENGLSIIYDPKTEHYTGLENRNYTWWEFSWPEVKDAVANTKRYQSHLNELNLAGINSMNAPTPGVPEQTASVPDNSGYVWHQTTDKKTISGFDCTRWIGDTLSGEGVEAWCVAGVQPKVQAAITALSTTSDPLALVPVRTLIPPTVLVVEGALTRGGVTPVLITWGGKGDHNSFQLLSQKTEQPKSGFFGVPKLYTRTTLITMDGIIDQK